ncbi:MAG: 30S ribosomal protein S12 methylthiotransferase RimO [Bacteroidales bacterium]|nr:30S ribosomal protein S12 methylthiotransferase RimO [Bacteroidales bacterium]
MKKKTIAIVTLGCSKNLVDSEDLATRIAQKYDVVYFNNDDQYASDVDIVIINTCGFILDAKQESIDTIIYYANLKTEGVIKKLFVFGCLSQRYKEDLAKEIPECDEFFGVNTLKDILDRLDVEDFDNPCDHTRLISTAKHTTYIKIAEGCNRKCSFCAIPYIRGNYISRPMEEIIEEVKLLASNGTKEFNLIAQDLSYYGKDLYHDFKLPELVEQLAKIDGVHWIRMHYTYPNNFPLKTLDLMKDNPKVCHYLDIPVQHISDHILSDMKRGHTKAETVALIKKFREIVPDITLRTSLLVGFPGETEEDIDELAEFIKEAKFDRLGVFQYSEEEGTYSAEHFKDDVPEEVKQERADRIMSIQQRISLQLNVAKIGKTMEIIIDRQEAEFWVGRTMFDSPEVDCEVLVKISDAPNFEIGNFYNVEITDVQEFDLFAKPV